jgi:predicted DNA-binding transcriptional regulator AlpA
MLGPPTPPKFTDPHRPDWMELEKIIDEKEAARLRGVSVDTLRRQAARGEGPHRIRLSPRRVGYRLGDIIGR